MGVLEREIEIVADLWRDRLGRRHRAGWLTRAEYLAGIATIDRWAERQLTLAYDADPVK